jgi:hypothetical protein
MAYQRADPRPFIPDTFQWVDVPNREFMCRAVAPARPPPTHEDLAIVTFDPLPGNVLDFTVIRNIVRDFLIGHRVVPRAVLPCHLGQAFVKFHHAYERDNMVRQSPMGFGNIQISFVKHNEGRNWRRVFFNEECWMMLLGFPDDYKSERHIHNAISNFARMILWEESDRYPGRIMIRARVISIEVVPQFIVYSDPTNVNGDSWTIQCEVVQHHQAAAEPPQEDPVPDELELEAFVPYDFFGLGQSVDQQVQGQE